mmetsp:Transcript_10367/g.30629  ORF Transcript_10367/g.30629 Transcript_10367/m.30629 type:complete len:526 (-) Transcript_10367:381-1958(-)
MPDVQRREQLGPRDGVGLARRHPLRRRPRDLRGAEVGRPGVPGQVPHAVDAGRGHRRRERLVQPHRPGHRQRRPLHRHDEGQRGADARARRPRHGDDVGDLLRDRRGLLRAGRAARRVRLGRGEARGAGRAARPRRRRGPVRPRRRGRLRVVRHLPGRRARERGERLRRVDQRQLPARRERHGRQLRRPVRAPAHRDARAVGRHVRVVHGHDPGRPVGRLGPRERPAVLRARDRRQQRRVLAPAGGRRPEQADDDARAPHERRALDRLGVAAADAVQLPHVGRRRRDHVVQGRVRDLGELPRRGQERRGHLPGRRLAVLQDRLRPRQGAAVLRARVRLQRPGLRHAAGVGAVVGGALRGVRRAVQRRAGRHERQHAHPGLRLPRGRRRRQHHGVPRRVGHELELQQPQRLAAQGHGRRRRNRGALVHHRRAEPVHDVLRQGLGDQRGRLRGRVGDAVGRALACHTRGAALAERGPRRRGRGRRRVALPARPSPRHPMCSFRRQPVGVPGGARRGAARVDGRRSLA